jgi:hypothetical protein
MPYSLVFTTCQPGMCWSKCAVERCTVVMVLQVNTQPSPTSIAQYKKKLELLDELAWDEHSWSDSLLCAAIASHAGKSRSFYVYKAAATWREITAVRQLLTQQDELQRNGNHGAEWEKCIDELHAHCEQLRDIGGLTLEAARNHLRARPS